MHLILSRPSLQHACNLYGGGVVAQERVGEDGKLWLVPSPLMIELLIRPMRFYSIEEYITVTDVDVLLQPSFIPSPRSADPVERMGRPI